MYEKFYGLNDDPFRLLPDPEICYSHRSNGSAWAYLRFALKRGEGIIVISGPPGSGKTTLVHRLLNRIDNEKVVTVSLVADDLTPIDLLRKLGYALGLAVEGKDRAMLTLEIEAHLTEVQQSNRRVLVVIDEAQSLSHQALEAVRRLSDLQPKTRAVLQLILFGQEELESVLAAEGMEQFQHRVIASCKLEPMSARETKAYLKYRLSAAGWSGNPSFSGAAIVAIYRHSRGVPRYVNKICSRLLLHGCTLEKHLLEESDVEAVVSDLRRERLAPRKTEGGSNVVNLQADDAETAGIGSAVELQRRDGDDYARSTDHGQHVEGRTRRRAINADRFVRMRGALVGLVTGAAVLGLLGWKWANVPSVAADQETIVEESSGPAPTAASSVLQSSGYVSSYDRSTGYRAESPAQQPGVNGGQYRSSEEVSTIELETLTGHSFPLLDNDIPAEFDLSAENEDVQTPLLQRIISHSSGDVLDTGALTIQSAGDAVPEPDSRAKPVRIDQGEGTAAPTSGQRTGEQRLPVHLVTG